MRAVAEQRATFAAAGSVDSEVRRTVVCVRALEGFFLSAIEAGAIKTFLKKAAVLDEEVERALTWCDRHAGKPLPRDFRRRMQDACREMLEIRASLG